MRQNGQEATVETIDEVRAELDRTMVKRTSPWKSAATLIITMAIFIIFGLRAGFFEASWFGIGLILVVIFIHELGHFAGMKLAGYRHVKMFFIPLLGAAVSGCLDAHFRANIGKKSVALPPRMYYISPMGRRPPRKDPDGRRPAEQDDNASLS